jgi:hypothetical protein
MPRGHVTGAWSDPVGSGTITGSVSNGGTASINILYPGSPEDTIKGHGVTTLTTTGAMAGDASGFYRWDGRQ